MLQAVIVTMAVVGCNHQATNCDRLPQPATIWESRKQCEAEIRDVVRRPDYPIIFAKCDEKVVIAISAASKTKTAKKDRPSIEPSLGEPLNIIPVKSTQTVKLSDDQSVVATVIRSTKHSYIVVHEGTWEGYEKLRNGTTGAYSRMRGGVGVMVAATVKFAERSADTVTDFISPDGQI